MVESLIIRIYLAWSLLWILLLVLEWARARRADRLIGYFSAWFGGGIVLVAARLILA